MSLWCDVCAFYILQVATPFVDLFAAPPSFAFSFCLLLRARLTFDCLTLLSRLSFSFPLSLSVSAGIFVFNYFLKSRLIENCALLFEVFRLIK